MWKKCGDVWICVRCGITRLNDGRLMFDKKFVNYKFKKRKAKNAND